MQSSIAFTAPASFRAAYAINALVSLVLLSCWGYSAAGGASSLESFLLLAGAATSLSLLAMARRAHLNRRRAWRQAVTAIAQFVAILPLAVWILPLLFWSTVTACAAVVIAVRAPRG